MIRVLRPDDADRPSEAGAIDERGQQESTILGRDIARMLALMTRFEIIDQANPHQVLEFPYGTLKLYRIGGQIIGRAAYRPGWRWTEHMAPQAGTPLCEVGHVGLVLQGSAAILMATGEQTIVRAGDFFAVEPGHDSWVVGTEPYVSLHFDGAQAYAAGGRA